MKEWIYVYVCLSPFSIHLKLSDPCLLIGYAAATAKSLQLCPTLCDSIDGSPPGSPVPDSPGKNTGVGCHFLLQCMKSESEVVQSCGTLSDPIDCSLAGSSIHGIFQTRVLEWGAIACSKGCFYEINFPACFVKVLYPNTHTHTHTQKLKKRELFKIERTCILAQRS